jgi:hypothetical protein
VLLRKSVVPDFIDLYPPFQIDGNFGGTAGICEMLLRRHAGGLDLPPERIESWGNGCRVRTTMPVKVLVGAWVAPVKRLRRTPPTSSSSQPAWAHLRGHAAVICGERAAVNDRSVWPLCRSLD